MNDLDADADAVDPLHARFTGRRAWVRVPCRHAVRMHGEGEASFLGHTIDLSRGGVLVTLTDEAFRTDDEHDGLSLISERFSDGAEIVFLDVGVKRRATIVRATLQHGPHLALGCAFESPLSKLEALALEIVAGESGVAEAGAPSLPWVPRPGVTLSLVILGATEDVVGPFALGEVQAAGLRTIEATFAKPADAVAASCRVEPFNTLLVVGRERVWTGKGTLVVCRPELPGSRIRVLTEMELDRRARKRLAAASGA